MVTDSSAIQQREPFLTAKEHIETGPVPAWVDVCPLPVDFRGVEGTAVTHLLLDRQIHAEFHQTFFHAAVRLENIHGVENQTPWRLNLEQQQQVTLHWIKTWRGGAQIEHLNLLSTARLIERDASSSMLERRTLLLMLEDVRPGDILEWCYTMETRLRLLPDKCAALFTLPAQTAIGKFHFSVRFNPARPMQWKLNEPDWQPVETHPDGSKRWAWSQENYPGYQPEVNTPDWFMDYPWIQVSDCPDWETVSTAFAEAWECEGVDATAQRIASDIAAGGGEAAQQAARAIQMVQDEYRFLPSVEELDGQPPVSPELVARRRYGDARDLGFLLASVLNGLGIPSRLVLVNKHLRKSVAHLLPAHNLFNHVVVEYRIRAETKWVDATLKHRVGASLLHVSREHGAGLPLDRAGSPLVDAPAPAGPGSVCELQESILLDTSGNWSLLAVKVAARGSHAEALRRELESAGLEEFAKVRQRNCADRFINVRRIGTLEYRDDREANEFFLAEVFEIKDFLAYDPKSKWFKFELNNDYGIVGLKEPALVARQAPFALPYPCQLVYTLELHSVALAPVAVQQRRVDGDFLSFTRMRETVAGRWTLVLTVTTLADVVPPEFVPGHRETFRKIRAQSGWSIILPPGEPHSRERSDFRMLPSVVKRSAAVAPPRPPLGTWTARRTAPPPEPAPPAPELQTVPVSVEAVAPIAPPMPVEVPAEVPALPILEEKEELEKAPLPPEPAPAAPPKMRRQKRVRRRRESAGKRHIFAACAMAVTLIVIAILAAKYADLFNVFKIHPKPPVVPIQGPANTPGQ